MVLAAVDSFETRRLLFTNLLRGHRSAMSTRIAAAMMIAMAILLSETHSWGIPNTFSTRESIMYA